MRTISVLGSTGSVGRSTLAVIREANAASEDGPVFDVDVLCAGQNAALLAEQAIEMRVRLAVIAESSALEELQARLAGHAIETACGADAIRDAAARPCHRLVAAIVGIAGLPSTLAAVRAGNDVALANKESLICAASLIKAEATRSGARIVPMDSEHSAIFQVLHDRGDVEKLTLTASGGPFLDTPLDQLGDMSVAQARAHPRWSMGLKISIDSATMMNKALEVIEAAYLFDKTADEIDVVVHPQSIIHSMVSYRDGSVLAQLGDPDMRTPVAYALSWPDTRLVTEVSRLDLAAVSRLDFRALDGLRFPAILLAKQALRAGGSAPLILNCANEAAVAAFILGECRFIDISSTVDKTLEFFSARGFGDTAPASLDEVSFLDAEGRKFARELLRDGQN